MQQHHAGKLLECGDAAVSLLIQEVRMSRGMGVRYDPSPVELLKRLGPGAHDAILTDLREDEARGNSEQPTDCREERLALMYALAFCFDDWTYLEEWIANIRELPPSMSREFSLMEMDSLVGRRFGDEARPRVYVDAGMEFNREFESWWQSVARQMQAKD
jgi:hypothetical protein